MKRLLAVGLLLLGTFALFPTGVTAATAALPSPPSKPEPPEDDSPFGQAYRDALVSFKSGLYDNANAACDKAIRISPKDARGPILKGRITAAKGETAKAEALLKQGLALDPGSVTGHRALGDLHFRQRQFNEARLAFLDAQRYDSSTPPDTDLALLVFYCDLGMKTEGDLGEAERIFAKFNAMDEKVPAWYFAKAALEHAKGPDPKHEAAAKKDLEDATVLYGTEVFAKYARDYFFIEALKDPKKP